MFDFTAIVYIPIRSPQVTEVESFPLVSEMPRNTSDPMDRRATIRRLPTTKNRAVTNMLDQLYASVTTSSLFGRDKPGE